MRKRAAVKARIRWLRRIRQTVLLSGCIELKREPAYGYAGKKGAEPDRQACRKQGSHAPDDAGNEPGEARRLAGSDLSANPKIRERHQPHWRQPSPADLSYSSGAGGFLL